MIPERTPTSRRALLTGIAGSLGLAILGTTSSHPGSGDHDPLTQGHTHGASAGTTLVGYHSLGGVGSESVSGTPDEPHYGGIGELKVYGDLAFATILSSKDPTVDRGLAILDVSAYTRADSRSDLDDAEMAVLSFVPNENGAASIMDVKVSADGKYVFLSKQPIAVLFEDEETRTDPENVGNTPEAGALLAVDVTDPGNPEIVGRYDAWALGPHNCDHHRIGGQDYVFAVKGTIGLPGAIYVLEFDRETGALTLVNKWTHDTELAQGEVSEPTDELYATNGYEHYAHDITLEDDPKTGRPLAYLANFSYARVLDVSDPQDIRELGSFDMERSHEIEPATVHDANGDLRRVFVTGQENPHDSYGAAEKETGFAYLVDCDDVFDPDFPRGTPGNLGTASTVDPDADHTELAKWDLLEELDRDEIEFENYTLSLHNFSVLEKKVSDGTFRQFVVAGHYHAGLRVLTMDVGSGPATSSLGQCGFSREHREVPDESKFAELSAATPDFWCAVEQNGVVFASGINTGVYAFTVDNPVMPVGTDQPVDVTVTRSGSGDAFTAGQTERIELSVDADEPVELRDRIPRDWDVHETSPHVETVREVADGTLVEFGEIQPGESVEYFVEVSDETGPCTVGAVQVSTDGMEWSAVADTADSNVVVGVSTEV